MTQFNLFFTEFVNNLNALAADLNRMHFKNAVSALSGIVSTLSDFMLTMDIKDSDMEEYWDSLADYLLDNLDMLQDKTILYEGAAKKNPVLDIDYKVINSFYDLLKEFYFEFTTLYYFD